MDSVLSTRSIKASSAEPSLLYTGFVKCKADPYHPLTNPDGAYSPPNTANISGLTKKRRYSEIGSIESHIQPKNLIWDLESGGGIGGRRCWEGRY